MGGTQDAFLKAFQNEFAREIDRTVRWSGGQVTGNRAGFPGAPSLRRGGKTRAGETFELGDLRADVADQTVVIEYDGEGVSLHNLAKYWPYITGELSARPTKAILLCHFSSWASYGSYRELWEWLAARIAGDSNALVGFHAHQFDHGGSNANLRTKGIGAALDWLKGRLNV